MNSKLQARIGHGIKTRSVINCSCAVSSKLVLVEGSKEVSSSSGSIGHWGGSEPAGEETKNE